MKPKFIMLCGLPASGKSQTTIELKKMGMNIYSSDEIRVELTGNINNQKENDLVFKTLHNRIREDLKKGKDCVYDACNTSYKRRRDFLQNLKKIPCEKICIFMATPLEECIKRNSERERAVPQKVIEKMYKNFNIPYYYEGWDEIRIIYNEPRFKKYYGEVYDFYDKTRFFCQQNNHHSLSLGEHCLKTAKIVEELLDYNGFTDYNIHAMVLSEAAFIHDCGKPNVKDFHNKKGERTDEAHYYSHNYTGAYNSFFYNTTESTDHRLYIAILIMWHMQPYFMEEKKTIEKYHTLWGKDLYNDIMTLHEADKRAH